MAEEEKKQTTTRGTPDSMKEEAKGSSSVNSQRAPLTEKNVMDFMSRFLLAFETGDPTFFKLFAKDMSIFTVSTPTRIDGLEVYQHGFEPYFLDVTRKSQLLSPEVRLLGPDSAVITFHNRVLVKGQASNLRGTVILARGESGELECVHMHNSPLSVGTATVSPPARGSSTEDVTLLEERVAAASAMVGTPK